MTEVQKMVRRVVERAGSLNLAAPMIGVSYRHVSRWLSGKSNPTEESYHKILMVLEGDNVRDRDLRIREYARRVKAGLDVFDG